MGKSTFELAVLMMKWLPLWLVDMILLILAWLLLGNIEKYGLKRPLTGPLELKNSKGKTPVLDIGALEKIKSGDIQVVPGIKRFSRGRVELINGEKLDVDSVVLATGYRSNVPSWLQVRKLFLTLIYVGKIYILVPLFCLNLNFTSYILIYYNFHFTIISSIGKIVLYLLKQKKIYLILFKNDKIIF